MRICERLLIKVLGKGAECGCVQSLALSYSVSLSLPDIICGHAHLFVAVRIFGGCVMVDGGRVMLQRCDLFPLVVLCHGR